MNDVDRLVGENIARQRGVMSQEQVALRMRARGWKWSQSTMWSIERGDRPVRVAEAVDLATVLGISPDNIAILWSAGGLAAHREAVVELDVARQQLERAIDSFLRAQILVASTGDLAEVYGDDRTRAVALIEAAPEDLVAQVRQRRAPEVHRRIDALADKEFDAAVDRRGSLLVHLTLNSGWHDEHSETPER